MTVYRLTGEGYVIRDGDTKVPTVDSPLWPNTNPDYLAYKQWLADGGVPLPAPPLAPVIPDVCSPAQGLVALYALKSITEQHILDALAQIPDPVQRYTAQIGYGRATEWRRDSPTMQAMAALLGLSEADLDALFTYAVGVQV